MLLTPETNEKLCFVNLIPLSLHLQDVGIIIIITTQVRILKKQIDLSTHSWKTHRKDTQSHLLRRLTIGLILLTYQTEGINKSQERAGSLGERRKGVEHAQEKNDLKKDPSVGLWPIYFLYMFQCYSLKYPTLAFSHSLKVCSVHMCLFFCFAYRVIITIFLNSIYTH